MQELAEVFKPSCDDETAMNLAHTIFAQADDDGDGLLFVDEIVMLMSNDLCNWDNLGNHVAEQTKIEQYQKEHPQLRRRKKRGGSSPSPTPKPGRAEVGSSIPEEGVQTSAV